jgi:hypothetical protein
MSNPINVLVRQDESDDGVALYTHWGGYHALADVQSALARRQQWDNIGYLTRIIFCHLCKEDAHDGQYGYGIATTYQTRPGSFGDDITVWVDPQRVEFNGESWTFEEFLKLDAAAIERIMERA